MIGIVLVSLGLCTVVVMVIVSKGYFEDRSTLLLMFAVLSETQSPTAVLAVYPARMEKVMIART